MLREKFEHAVNMRLFTINHRTGSRTYDIVKAATEFRRWLDFNKKASDEAVKAYLERNWEMVMKVCTRNKAGQSLKRQITEIVFPNLNHNNHEQTT